MTDILDFFFLLLLVLRGGVVVLPILGVGGVLLVSIVVARQAVQPLVLLILELFLPLVSGGVKDLLGGVLAPTLTLPDLPGSKLGLFSLPVDDCDLLSSSPDVEYILLWFDNDDDDTVDTLGQFRMVPGILVVVDVDSNSCFLFSEDDGRLLMNIFPGAEDDSLSQSPKSRVGWASSGGSEDGQMTTLLASWIFLMSDCDLKGIRSGPHGGDVPGLVTGIPGAHGTGVAQLGLCFRDLDLDDL